MNNFRFKHVDVDGENEFKIGFDVSANISKDETILEVDGDISIEDHNGDFVEFTDLSKVDQKLLLDAVDSWLELESMENGYNYYEDYLDGLSDYYFDSMEDR